LNPFKMADPRYVPENSAVPIVSAHLLVALALISASEFTFIFLGGGASFTYSTPLSPPPRP
jgi:hypothetical protein